MFTRMPQGWSPSPAHWRRHNPFSNLILSLFAKSALFYARDCSSTNANPCSLKQRSLLWAHKYLRTAFLQSFLRRRFAPWRTPTTRSQLRQFLRTVNSLREHIPGLSNIMRDMTHLTSDSQKWVWTADSVLSGHPRHCKTGHVFGHSHARHSSGSHY